MGWVPPHYMISSTYDILISCLIEEPFSTLSGLRCAGTVPFPCDSCFFGKCFEGKGFERYLFVVGLVTSKDIAASERIETEHVLLCVSYILNTQLSFATQ